MAVEYIGDEYMEENDRFRDESKRKFDFKKSSMLDALRYGYKCGYIASVDRYSKVMDDEDKKRYEVDIEEYMKRLEADEFNFRENTMMVALDYGFRDGYFEAHRYIREKESKGVSERVDKVLSALGYFGDGLEGSDELISGFLMYATEARIDDMNDEQIKIEFEKYRESEGV